uniref:cytochrome c oxidase subunit III n=1 Tax=Austromenopon paululum TaxID=2965261 RepID=UPI0026E1BB25|nr:cytochrome c oxidase subunit III [Austromenopon paululum]WJJ69873.1 cytochrome c oxidase subunit 3 [Austromenopon paululum]
MLSRGWFSYHLVDFSPWPLLTALAILMGVTNVILELSLGSLNLETSSFMLAFFCLCLWGWLRDIVSEGLYQGAHTLKVQSTLKLGMVLFIFSEVLFFFAFFWALGYYSVSPHVDTNSWPPKGIHPVNPMGVPLLGSILLLSSSISATWSHHSILLGKKSSTSLSLGITVLLGALFLVFQIKEYQETTFGMNDSVYGSIFYLATGFHGFHVFLGSIMLFVSLSRLLRSEFSSSHHLGLEMSIWYWHFVDVVWLFLYICAYWGSKM